MINLKIPECKCNSRIKKFTESIKQSICDMYLSGLSTVKIGNIFNCDHKTISKVLDEYDICRTGVGLRKYELNEHYFDIIDTPNKAYILGFFYADGSNCESKQTIAMSLQEDDKNILEAIRLEINSQKPLEYIDCSKKHDGGYHYKNQYRLLMFSKHMSNILRDKGMPHNKSLTLQWPTFLSSDLYADFIRGYYDGDGSVYRSGTNYTVTITSTNEFCVKLKDIVESTIGVHCGIYDAQNHNGITKVFAISGKNQVKKFLDWIYEDAALLLERKHNRYLQYFYNSIQDTSNTSTE